MEPRTLDCLPVGVLTLDRELRIRGWNRWLADKTGITPQLALGRDLRELFPGAAHPRFLWAVEQVCRQRSPQILSQSLNAYLLPIPIQHAARHGLTMMQQHVHIEPLSRGGEVLAVVTLMDVTENVIRSSALLEKAQKLHQDSNRDPLTGLFNRRFMWDWLGQQFKRAVRAQGSIACLILDLDHFKAINDSHGHDVGDRVLQDMAVAVASRLRGADVVVRYGGEELVALLPDCPLPRAVEAAERIRRYVEESRIAGLDAGAVTVSIGVAVYTPEHPCSGEELLKRADRRLYDAKNRGRNQVVPAPEESVEGG